MIVSKNKQDYIEVDEGWLYRNSVPFEKKIHLVKLNFKEPNKEKVEQVIDLLPKTNRFIISDNIRIYNSIFKDTRKKYYVENTSLDKGNFISFLRKNNKILLNFAESGSTLNYVLFGDLFEDLLRNVEIIKMNSIQFTLYKPLLENWSGNVILMD